MNDIALFDMDGTLADYEGVLMKGLERLAAPDEPVSMDDSIPHIEARMRLIKSQSGWWKNLPVLADGMDILGVADEIGFDIHILTKGPYHTTSAWTEKREWCKQFVPDAKVTITEDKWLVYGKVLVDDYPEYMKSWLHSRPRGLGIMPARKINAGFSHPNVLRYEGRHMLGELYERLKWAKERSNKRST